MEPHASLAVSLSTVHSSKGDSYTFTVECVVTVTLCYIANISDLDLVSDSSVMEYITVPAGE